MGRGRTQSGRPGLGHSCGSRAPMSPRSRHPAASGKAAARRAGSGCPGPGRRAPLGEGLKPRRPACGPGFHLHRRQGSRTRGTMGSRPQALHTRCLHRRRPPGCRSTAGTRPAASCPPGVGSGNREGTGVGTEAEGRAGSGTALPDTRGPTSPTWKTGSGSAAPRAHTSGCSDSRLTSGSRRSGQEAGRAEPCRRAARPGTCSCCRPPGAGSPGPRCGPGRLCTRSDPFAHSRRPAPGSPPSSGSPAGRPGRPDTRSPPGGLSSGGGSGWRS